MINQLLWWDHRLFEWVNNHLHNANYNWFFILMRNSSFWIPLYLLLISWVFVYYKRIAWWIIMSCIILVSLTDQLNSKLLKNSFKRERPCRELYFKDHFETLIDCSGGYSFPSSHAANHAGLGIFFFMIFKNSMGKGRYFFILWPILIGFSQIFVGVHFPIDIIVGWLVGFICGFIVYLILSWFLNKYSDLSTN